MAIATVIGGAGGMGAWFARFLRKKGYTIIISDTNTRIGTKMARNRGFQFVKDWEPAVQQADVVVLATPTQATKGILSRIEPHLPSSSLLVEISSIKAPVKAILLRMKRRGVAVLSIHPMFGPGIRKLMGRTIITTLLPRGATASKFLSLFRKEGARIVHVNFDMHDKLASVTLTLPHFVNVVLAKSIRSSGFGSQELNAVAGTTFTLQSLVAETVYSEGSDNAISILMDNPSSLKILKAFVKHSYGTLSVVTKRKRSDMVEELRRGRRYFEKDLMFPRAQERFNSAVEASSPH
jgi:prephenate dehydrogenase